MTKLHEVFGIGRDIPKYTYVDRAGLDIKLTYLLKTQRHIVIHGASKQGKSCLRKKNINEDTCVIIQCLPEMPLQDLWKSAFRKMEIAFPENVTKSQLDSTTSTLGGNIEGHVFVAKGSVNGELSKNNQKTESVTKSYIEGQENDLRILAEALLTKNKRLIFEDFHYLSEYMRKQVAFSLKALYELGVYVIIVGIWSEQNLLTYYNGDLTGRIEEINLNWNEAELKEVLNKGEKVLNIEFSNELKQKIVDNSFQNVGILQRVAEKICLTEQIHEEQKGIIKIDNLNIIETANKQIVRDIGQRYNRIFEVFVRGFKSETKLKIYYLIFRVFTQVDERQLIFGMPSTQLLKEMQKLSEHEIRLTDLIQSLDRIERLQSSRDITPLLVSYNRSLKTLALMDREFLFYRKFSGESWDWDEKKN